MPNDYVNLKNLQGAEIKPITDLAAINLTEVNGIAVEGNTIGIQDGYIESAYYTEMVDPTVGPAASSSAYVEGGTIYTLLGGYAVTSAINTASPSQQKVPSEAAVVSAFNDIVVSGASYYAGTGINIDAGHTVSVANVPTSAVAGLDTQLTGISASVAGKQDAISAGYRMELSGTTLSQARYFPIESPTSATITLQAGHAYKIQATAGSKTLTAETIPANQFGLEGHAEIFIANTGLIKTTSSVVLANALEPDAVNNCTVRFHDGLAIISVEDHVAGYIVVSATGTMSGTLPYALGSSSQEYVAFDASLNGQTLDLAGAVTNGEKHVVGNGYTETIISGGINCTSKTTLSNLAADGVIVSSGTLTLGDVYIPSGSTVAVSGGGLAIEKVTGNGGVIDLGGTNVELNGTRISSASLSGCTLTSGSATYGGAVYAAYGVSATLRECSITGNSAGYGGGCNAGGGSYLLIDSCVVTGNSDGDIRAAGASTSILISASTVGTVNIAGGTVNIAGRNTIDVITSKGGSGSVTISSGAILDLTGNTNPAPIAPGGGITFAPGGATVYPSAGQASAYMLGGMTVPTIGNTNVVNLNSSNITVPPGGSAIVSGAVFAGGSASYGGAFLLDRATLAMSDTIISGCSASAGGAIYLARGSVLSAARVTFLDNQAETFYHITIENSDAEFSSCTQSGGAVGALYIQAVGAGSSATATITDCEFSSLIKVNAAATVLNIAGTNTLATVNGSGSVTISSGASINLASSIAPSGGITVLTGGCTVNGNAIPAGTYTSINSNGQPT